MTDPHASFRSPSQQVAGLGLFEGIQKGRDGADSAAQHLVDECPGWLLRQLGDCLCAFNGSGAVFSSDAVREALGRSADQWFTAKPERQNCFSGWWMKAVKRHGLIRVGSTVSKRGNRHGAYIATWRFP